MENSYLLIGVILSIVGAFGTLALGVNAYFLRGIFSDLNRVRIDLATVIAESHAKDERIGKLEEQERETLKRVHKLELKLEVIK